MRMHFEINPPLNEIKYDFKMSLEPKCNLQHFVTSLWLLLWKSISQPCNSAEILFRRSGEAYLKENNNFNLSLFNIRKLFPQVLNLDSKFPHHQSRWNQGCRRGPKVSLNWVKLLRKIKCFDTFIAKRLAIEVYTRPNIKGTSTDIQIIRQLWLLIKLGNKLWKNSNSSTRIKKKC